MFGLTSILNRPLKMTSTSVDPSLLSTSMAAFSSARYFKFPARTPPTVVFGRKTIKVSSCATITTDDDSNESRFCASYGRRALVLAATIPFLLPLHQSTGGFGANALDEVSLIQGEVRKVLSKGKAAGVLRLVFHDAGTFEMEENSGGMNGSVVFELDRPENGGLKKSLKILEKAKSEVDVIQPVSWADMIAVAGAEAVSVCGGPKIPVLIGRIDSITQELVALSGAHTLGSKGFGNPVVFDNSYFKILLEKPWLSSAGMSSMIGLPSDRALVDDDDCLRWISRYADNQDLFFEDFKNAYIKLVNSGAKWK
ncbi:unnamed protein product [Ilex paraguariensis]|uniref:Plant heme peroxidase family profile domain-containing protein n=1 Tax=Ilex paraguariensis TaxID=185542 RepID=A0ABC8TQS9_9AQUA